MDIAIIGLGTDGQAQLTLEALDIMRGRVTVFRTDRHGACEWLLANGVEGFSLDRLYEGCQDFDELIRLVTEAVINAAKEFGGVAYAVPGCACFGDATVSELILRAQKAGISTRIVPGVGYAQTAAAMAGGLDGAVICPAISLAGHHINTRVPLVVTELDDRMLAGEVKLKLAQFYPDEWPVLMSDIRSTRKIPLNTLDRQENYGYFSAIVVHPVDILSLSRYDFSRLMDIASILRGHGAFPGCPWDMEQTHESLTQDVLEEAYEVADAIASGDTDALYGELGDLLLQVALHSQIGSEYDEFDISDVTTGICQKMISRHPHVFGQAVAKTSCDVLDRWEDIKMAERRHDGVADAMRALPRGFPALMRAAKALSKARQAGFDYADDGGAYDKVSEELAEVRDAARSGNRDDLLCELGDLLLAAADVARLHGAKPELLLSRATDGFIERFDRMERLAAEKGRDIRALSPIEQEKLWEKAKKQRAGK